MNPYEALSINKEASREEIEKAYLALAKKHHPDVGGDGDKFASVSRAVAILRDPVKRQHFDDTGAEMPSRSSRLEGALAECLNALIQAKEDFSGVDLAELMGNLFESERLKNLAALTESERRLARAKRYRKRFKTKRRGQHDQIGRLLDGHQATIKRDIAKAREQVEFFEECKRAVAGYVAPPDMEERPSVFSPARYAT